MACRAAWASSCAYGLSWTSIQESIAMHWLPDYFARIGIAAPAIASKEALQRIVFAHAVTIPFENLDPLQGKAVSLKLDEVVAKLVHGRRGGWCFEQNLLLGEALRALGFEVADLGARVLWGRPLQGLPARTHRLLQVRCDDETFLADVGFGGQTLTGVLTLTPNVEQSSPHESCRVRQVTQDWLLETRIGSQWLPLYQFDLAAQLAVDFEAVNFQLAHDPGSHFVHNLIAARAAPEGRHTLRNRDLKFHRSDGTTVHQVVPDVNALRAVLNEVFDIAVPQTPALSARLFGLF